MTNPDFVNAIIILTFIGLTLIAYVSQFGWKKFWNNLF